MSTAPFVLRPGDRTVAGGPALLVADRTEWRPVLERWAARVSGLPVRWSHYEAASAGRNMVFVVLTQTPMSETARKPPFVRGLH